MTTTNQVSQAQLDLCHRVVDESTGEVFYKVESESTSAEYSVRYTFGKGFSCSCPSGQQGFANCHANPTCKHVRWAVEHARLFKLEAHTRHLMELGLTYTEACEALSHQLLINGAPADDETLVRVWGPRYPRPTEAEIDAMAEAYEARPFNILK